MKVCVECGQRLRDPKCRHRCPHGKLCIGPSIHTVKTILRSNGTSRVDRDLYCQGCCLFYYGEAIADRVRSR